MVFAGALAAKRARWTGVATAGIGGRPKRPARRRPRSGEEQIEAWPETNLARASPATQGFRLQASGSLVESGYQLLHGPKEIAVSSSKEVVIFGVHHGSGSDSFSALGTKDFHLYTSRRWPILITSTTSRRSSMVYRMR